MVSLWPVGVIEFLSPKPGDHDEHGLCLLSELTVIGCQHCITGAPNLGYVTQILGYEYDDAQEAA